jgi:MFS family permease
MTSVMDQSSPPRLLRDPNLHIIFSITLMAVVGVASLSPTFPRMAEVLNVSAKSIGLLITVFTVPGVVMTPVLGVLADRYGRKTILVPSLLLFAIAGTACAFARDFTTLLVLRFVQGVGGASLGSLNATLIGDLYEGRRRTAAMGYNATVLSLGTASYPAIGGALAMLSWRYPFALPVFALPVALFVLSTLKNPEPKSQQSLRTYLKDVGRGVGRREVIGLFVVSGVTFIIMYGAQLTYFPFRMSHGFGASPFLIGVIMATSSLSTAVAASRLGALARRYSEQAMMKVGFLLLAAGAALIPLMPSPVAMLIPTIIWGTALGMTLPNISTLLASLAPLEQRGAFMSLNGMTLRLGQTLGPLVMALVYGVWGISGTFFVAAALAVALFAVTAQVIGGRTGAGAAGRTEVRAQD